MIFAFYFLKIFRYIKIPHIAGFNMDKILHFNLSHIFSGSVQTRLPAFGGNQIPLSRTFFVVASGLEPPTLTMSM